MSGKAIARGAAGVLLAAWMTSATEAASAPAAKPWSVRMADSEMKRTPDPLMLDAVDTPRWEYTPGLVLKAVVA